MHALKKKKKTTKHIPSINVETIKTVDHKLSHKEQRSNGHQNKAQHTFIQ